MINFFWQTNEQTLIFHMTTIHFYTASLSDNFKNAPAFLLRDAHHAMHDILLLRIRFLTFWSWYYSIKNKKISPTYSVELIFIYNVFKNSNNYSLSSAVSVLKSSSVVLFELLFLDSEESVLSSSLSDFESEDFVLPPFALAAASFAEFTVIPRP